MSKINTEKVIFIDTISKTMKKVSDQGEGVYYVSSPGALTELSLVIKKFLTHDFDYLIFDAVTNLSTYQNKNMCTKFLNDLTACDTAVKKGDLDLIINPLHDLKIAGIEGYKPVHTLLVAGTPLWVAAEGVECPPDGDPKTEDECFETDKP